MLYMKNAFAFLVVNFHNFQNVQIKVVYVQEV